MFPLLIATALASPVEAPSQQQFLADEREDCVHSMRELGYRSRRSEEICDCYVGELEKLLDDDRPVDEPIPIEATGQQCL